MGLIDTLRKAEEQGKEAARKTLERARSGMEDTERRLRRKMRVLPTAKNHASQEKLDPQTHRVPEPVPPMTSEVPEIPKNEPREVRKKTA